MCLVLDVAGWSGDQLRQAVRDLDATEDAVPIAKENVDVQNILTVMFSGDLGVTYQTLFQAIQEDDGPRKPWGEVFPPKLPGDGR